MARRKVSKTDVEQAYEIAKDAKKSALFSLRRARQLKDGADKLNKEYKGNQPKKTPPTKPTAKKTTTPKKQSEKKAPVKKSPEKELPWWAREEGE